MAAKQKKKMNRRARAPIAFRLEFFFSAFFSPMIKSTDEVVRNLKRMMSDRKYRIDNDVLRVVHFSVENEDDEDAEVISGSVKIVATAFTPENHSVCCILHDRDKGDKEPKSFGIDSIRKYTAFLQQEKFDQAIFLVDAKVTPQALNASKGAVLCEFFMFDTLTYIVVDHYKVPKFQRVPAEHVAAVLKELKAEPHQLRKMFAKDPICKYYGFQHGNIVRAEYASKENGMFVNYAIVV